GRPVTCSHELSSKLDGPRRALTCVLNARLIGLIDELISSTSTLLEARGIAAPLMVVRGDGALIAAEVARTCPVETVLSGPAASLVGAAWLHETERAIVSDIGGTTTDVALLSEGRPRLDPAGATVGGWRTMVEAVGMWTVGLGGDSEVRLERDGLAGVIALGPRRAVPLSLLAQTHRGLVLETLKRQARKDRIDERDGVFALQVRDAGLHGGALRDVEKKLLSQLADGPVPLDKLISVRMQLGALEKLVGRGIVMMASFTPSDAAHVLERYEAWNGDAARFGAKIFARRRTAAGKEISGDAETVSAMVLDALTRRSAETVLEAAFSHDGFDGAAAVSHPLVAAGLAHHDGAVKIDVGLSIPLIGLGASARTYYPAVGERLGVEAIVPTHAGVANAVGAVVGHVQISDQAVISQPEAGRFRVHLPGLVEAFSSQQDAIVFAERELGDMLSLRAEEAGAGDISLTFAQDVKTVEADGQEIFIEAVISGVARGRPRFQAADVG
ncbi:MAG: hydantoinase/oxoprolinase family protein, partial [Pseudomonadota bacterium]